MKYINTGICIWCRRSEPAVSFENEPHSIPKSLGSNTIGFDICDKCNHFFGTIDKTVKPSLAIEVCFKEIFGTIRFLSDSNKNENSYKQFRSCYFDYRHSKRTIEIRSTFKYNNAFLSTFTRQFCRGIYEIFLQEYHRQTENGLASEFDQVRDFARYNKGHLPVYYNWGSRVFGIEENMDKPHINISEQALSDIENYGFYSFWLWGHIFFIEVTPMAAANRELYLQKQASQIIIPVVGDEKIIELKNILSVDFFLRGLYDSRHITE